jgi:hypothetical protein
MEFSLEAHSIPTSQKDAANSQPSPPDVPTHGQSNPPDDPDEPDEPPPPPDDDEDTISPPMPTKEPTAHKNAEERSISRNNSISVPSGRAGRRGIFLPTTSKPVNWIRQLMTYTNSTISQLKSLSIVLNKVVSIQREASAKVKSQLENFNKQYPDENIQYLKNTLISNTVNALISMRDIQDKLLEDLMNELMPLQKFVADAEQKIIHNER